MSDKQKNESETTVYEITDVAPTLENSTRSKIKKGAAIGVFAAGALLLIDDQVKKFKARKNVTVTVEDSESNDSDSQPST